MHLYRELQPGLCSAVESESGDKGGARIRGDMVEKEEVIGTEMRRSCKHRPTKQQYSCAVVWLRASWKVRWRLTHKSSRCVDTGMPVCVRACVCVCVITILNYILAWELRHILLQTNLYILSIFLSFMCFSMSVAGTVIPERQINNFTWGNELDRNATIMKYNWIGV